MKRSRTRRAATLVFCTMTALAGPLAFPAVAQQAPHASYEEQDREREARRQEVLAALYDELMEIEHVVWELEVAAREAEHAAEQASARARAIAERSADARRRGDIEEALRHLEQWRDADLAAAAAHETAKAARAVAIEAREHHSRLAMEILSRTRDMAPFMQEDAVMAGAEPEPDYAVVEIQYGTDRNVLERDVERQRQLYGNDSVGLSLGVCHVSIPPNHKPGKIEAPWFWESPKPWKHVVLLDAYKLTQEGFENSLRLAFERATSNDMLLFIHGYNVDFESAALRAGQVTYDLGFDGPTAMFAWASKASADAYMADYDTASFQSSTHLAEFLKILAAQVGEGRIHIIAHSMGNMVLCRALEKLDAAGESDLRLGHLVLAAPDVPAQTFVDSFAEPLKRLSKRATIYASSKDLALHVSSRWLRQGQPRVGETNGQVTVVDGIHTVEADDFAKGLLYHSYFAEIESIIHDLIAAIRLGFSPIERCLIEQSVGSKQYWKCVQTPDADCKSELINSILRLR